MNNRTFRNILIILGIIILLLIVAYFLFMFKFPGAVIPQPVKTPVVTSTNNNLQNSAPPAAAPATPAKNPSAPPASSDTITQNNLVKIAESFAARLGSYSNQANFDNIKELKLYMTASMQSWADKYIAANQKAAYSGIYQGVTTQAISAEIANFDNAKGRADIIVHTQKVSVNGTSSPVTTQQDITITFVKQNNNWLVDNAVWKK
ncbi:MAG: hypothetical protein PHO56_04430 [Patescibacteria group bacterium]|nr:hypothetical protein [Patescibacteria group bacterium]